MPALGMGRESGRLVRWLKRQGERVAGGEPLLELEIEKAVIEVESPGTGILSGLRFQPGEEVPVGAVMAYLLAPTARHSPKPAYEAAQAPAAVGAVARQQQSAVLAREVDASQLIVARAKQPESVTLTDLVLKLVAVTLARHPLLNSGRTEVNVTVPVMLGEGPAVAPVIHGADRLDVPALAARRAELAERARAGRLRARDLADATFTLGDLGQLGVDTCLPIVEEGHTAALGVGRLLERVLPVRGRPQIRPVLALSLAVDPRVVDAASAARYLADLAEALEEPAEHL